LRLALSLIAFCSYKKKPWDKLVNTTNEELVDSLVFDLLTEMLKIDHIERISAKKALAHSYFDPIRAEAESLERIIV
jgi:casein kinase II subunit alpha